MNEIKVGQHYEHFKGNICAILRFQQWQGKTLVFYGSPNLPLKTSFIYAKNPSYSEGGDDLGFEYFQLNPGKGSPVDPKNIESADITWAKIRKDCQVWVRSADNFLEQLPNGEPRFKLMQEAQSEPGKPF